MELAEKLMDRAEEDIGEPVPVIFDLSSWAAEEGSISSWLCRDLHILYDVPLKLARRWVGSNRILPLLDGLDEVPVNRRDACVDALNQFRDEHGLLPIVVTCRSQEYEVLKIRVRVPGAISIQPLTREIVESVLKTSTEAVELIRDAVRREGDLWEFLNTPLMLSVTMLAHNDVNIHDLSVAPGTNDRLGLLLQAYVNAMSKRRRHPSNVTAEAFRHYLHFLASNMQRLNKTVCYLEEIDGSWLPLTVSERLGMATAFGWSVLWAFSLYPMMQSKLYVLSTILTILLANWRALKRRSRYTFHKLLNGEHGISVNQSVSEADTNAKWRTGPNIWTTYSTDKPLIQAILVCCGYPAMLACFNFFPPWLAGIVLALPFSGIALLDFRPTDRLTWSFAKAGSAGRQWLKGSLIFGCVFWVSEILREGKSGQVVCSFFRISLLGLRPSIRLGVIFITTLWLGDVVLWTLSSRWRNSSVATPWSWKSLARKVMRAGPMAIAFGFAIGVISHVKPKSEVANDSFGFLLLGIAFLTSVIALRFLWSLFRSTPIRAAARAATRGVHSVVYGCICCGVLSAIGGKEATVFLLGGIMIGFVSSSVMTVASGLIVEAMDTEMRLTANQALTRSLRNAAITTIVIWPFFAVLFHLLTKISIVRFVPLALSQFLLAGGFFCIQNVAVRFYLSLHHDAPFSYAQFLQEGSELLIFRKIGSGYTFMHRVLQDHLSSAE